MPGNLGMHLSVRLIQLLLKGLKLATSIRYVVRGVSGRRRQNFNWHEVIKSRQAVVQVTAAEIRLADSSIVLGSGQEQNFAYHLGDANIWVSNISPHDDHGGGAGVEYILHTDFSQPIDIAVTITVDDNTPVEIHRL